jgi:lipid-binding SYLF domain-containing protein
MTRSLTPIAGALALFVAFGCSTEPKTSEERHSLTTGAYAALERFRASDPSLQTELDKAAGYAVLPDVKKGGLIAGGAYGKGEVYEHGRQIGYCDMSQGTVGLQAGGQTYNELIIFRTDSALQKFKSNEFTFAANASAVAVKSGAGSAAQYHDDVAVFVQPREGLMAEAAIGGQKFRFEPLNESNQPPPMNQPTNQPMNNQPSNQPK